MEKVIIAQFSVHMKSIEPFIKLTKTLVSASMQEDGCLKYRLLNEIDKPNEFIIYEKYINEKAIETHNSSEHLMVYLKSVSTLLIDKPILNTY